MFSRIQNYSILLCVCFYARNFAVESFIFTMPENSAQHRSLTMLKMSSDKIDPSLGSESKSAEITDELRISEAKKFKVMVCGSTSCSRRRKQLMMDEYSTFSGVFTRNKESDVTLGAVEVEDSGCIGSCKKSPVVAVMHEDYAGYVGLEGMTSGEFGDSRFHKVSFEDDIDRVWNCVENAVEQMIEASLTPDDDI